MKDIGLHGQGNNVKYFSLVFRNPDHDLKKNQSINIFHEKCMSNIYRINLINCGHVIKIGLY